MLEIKNITVKFGELVAVKNFSMYVKRGTIHALIGPNGAGKTTVLNSIWGLNNYEGEIYYKGILITNLPVYKRPFYGISRTFQNLELFVSMNVEEHTILGLYPKLPKHYIKDILLYRKTILPQTLSSQIVKTLLSLGLVPVSKLYPILLPYTLRKTVEFGRAIVNQPELLILDEPSTGLDRPSKEQLKNNLLKLKSQGVTILLVEHDMSIVMSISDIITVMNFGEKIAEGKPEEILNDKNVIEAYLGAEE